MTGQGATIAVAGCRFADMYSRAVSDFQLLENAVALNALQSRPFNELTKPGDLHPQRQ